MKMIRRQNGECENESVLASRVRQRPEDEGRPIGGVMQQLIDGVPCPRHHALAQITFQDEQGEKQLQADAPGDNFPFDGFAIGGKNPARAEDGEDS